MQTALKHDTLIEGGDPDSIIVESEANRIAQSAARALRESCRQCQGGGGGGGGATWGQPTWTGQHGTVGAPKYTERERRGDEWKCQDDKNTQRTHLSLFF